MEIQAEKVHVFLGNDPQDGFETLEWVLKNWPPHSVSIVIIHAANNMSKNYVSTPFGKLPPSSVNGELLEVLRKHDEGKADKTLSKYKALCGKVKAEVLKINRYDEPTYKIIVEMISGLRITKLVLGITLLKSLPWYMSSYTSPFFSDKKKKRKFRSAISGPFYVQKHKPDFCELFVVCGGRLVFLREENNETIVEDEHGVIYAKSKDYVNFKRFLGKMFPGSGGDGKSPHGSPSSSPSNGSPGQWEKYKEEIEKYFHQLLSYNSDEENHVMENGTLQNSPREQISPENMSPEEKFEAMKSNITKAHKTILLNRKEIQDNAERKAKAEWAICLCSCRAEELEALRNKEIARRVDLEKDLEMAIEEVHEVQCEVEEKKSKLNSILEIQRELLSKLQSSSLAKSQAEAQLENSVRERAEMVQEIEELRRQRDVVQRRIEFCREKDAIGMAKSLSDLGFDYKEFTADEIRAATDDFSERLRMKSSGDWTNVYRGRLKYSTVAIKLYNSANGLSQEAFQTKVKLLSHIRHPHLVAMIGFCIELKCIVFEYMHNGCLRDALFSASSNSRRRNQGLNWHARIRIAAEVCSGLGFLRLARPRPIIHGNLNPSKILLDHNNVAKILGFRPNWSYEESDMRSDIRAFGNLVLQLLTGRNWAGLVEEAVWMDHAALAGVLDQNAGEWPLALAVELAKVAMKCLSIEQGPEMESRIAMVMREINGVKKKADALLAIGEFSVETEEEEDVDVLDSSSVPKVFLCPIFQDVMKNPHLAADGFSYEKEAIEGWLRTGHETSPATNLKLNHKLLTPNHTLRSLIEDWHYRRSIPLTQAR